MKDEDVVEILKFFLKKVKNLGVSWRIGGSVNLKVQGMDVEPRDVDIVTDLDGLDILSDEFDEYVVKTGYKDDLEGNFVLCKIDGKKLEFFAYDDFGKSCLNKRQQITWKRLKLFVLSLKETQDYYLETDRTKKAADVARFLLSQDK